MVVVCSKMNTTDNGYNSYDQQSALQAYKIKIHVYDTVFTHQKFTFDVFPWIKIWELKKMCRKILHKSTKRFIHVKMTCKNIKLETNSKSIIDYNIHSGQTINLSLDTLKCDCLILQNLFSQALPSTENLINSCKEGIQKGYAPELNKEGTSGNYLIKDAKGKNVAIFKPIDQEANAPNNPRGYVGKLGGQSLHPGILSGQCATRQVAAFLLDTISSFHPHFHGVPPTTYVQFFSNLYFHNQKESAKNQKLKIFAETKSKFGSLQHFLANNQPVGNFSSSKLSTEEVHKIGILDLRILNRDRNQGNILVQKTNSNGNIFLNLTPIDHGLSFPDTLEIYEHQVIWMSFPQSKEPFSPSILKYIKQIDPIKNSDILREKLSFRPICLRNCRIAEIFIKKAAAMGLTLYQMGKFIYRKQDQDNQSNTLNGSKYSKLQQIIIQTQNLILSLKDQQETQIQSFFSQLKDSSADEFSENIELLDANDIQVDKECQENKVQPIKVVQVCDKACEEFQLPKLKLIKKISLPLLIKRTTSCRQNEVKQRKKTEGINGVGIHTWKSYAQKRWSNLYFYYIQSMLETRLLQYKKKQLEIQSRKLHIKPKFQ